MPNYEYKCDDCGTTEEHKRDIDDRDNVPPCQYCTKPTHRVISPTAVKFNAPGFYSTGG